MKILALRLKELKGRCEKEKGEEVKVRLRSIVSKMGAKQCLSMEELNYLLSLAGLERRIGLKMNKVM